MTVDIDHVAVRDNTNESRFEAEVSGQTAIADYVLAGNTITFTHTLVPEQFRGQGIAEKLVRVALDQSRAAGLKVVAQCPYVAHFIAKHPEYQE